MSVPLLGRQSSDLLIIYHISICFDRQIAIYTGAYKHIISAQLYTVLYEQAEGLQRFSRKGVLQLVCKISQKVLFRVMCETKSY